MNGFGPQLWIYFKVGCVIPSLRKKVNLRRISHADLCKFLSDFSLSSDWTAPDEAELETQFASLDDKRGGREETAFPSDDVGAAAVVSRVRDTHRWFR